MRLHPFKLDHYPVDETEVALPDIQYPVLTESPWLRLPQIVPVLIAETFLFHTDLAENRQVAVLASGVGSLQLDRHRFDLADGCPAEASVGSPQLIR